MRRYVSSHWFIGLVLALALLLIGGNLALKSSKGAKQDQVAEIINETDSLQVEDLNITDHRPGEKQYSFSLRNISNKEIVAWVITSSFGGTQIMGATMGGGLAPGESRTTGAYDMKGDRVGDKKIVIKFAMFADGSSEGDFKFHREITDSREGSRIQTERINALIEAAVTKRKGRPNEGGEKEWLATVAAAISELPETSPDPARPMMAYGMNSPKQMALRYIAALGEWEETRHKDSVKADKIMRETGEVVFGSRDVTDGLEHIAHHNEWLIGKKKEKTGGANAK
jgi:hypothetical protein